jgi:hypothetical protein
MAAKDLFHDAVRHALEKDGWTITHDPLEIRYGDVTVVIDLGAENVIGAERQGEKIAVEIKSFVSRSPLTDFHAALGQFLNYRLALAAKMPERTLYLAIPDDAYNTFFKKKLVQESAQVYGLKLIVYDSAREEIVRWTN